MRVFSMALIAFAALTQAHAQEPSMPKKNGIACGYSINGYDYEVANGKSLCWRAPFPYGAMYALLQCSPATTSGNYPGETRRSPLRRPIRDATIRFLAGGSARAHELPLLQSHRLLSKVQLVDQRMRLECGVGFRQLRTWRGTRPGQLCA